MKKTTPATPTTLKEALKTISVAARRKAFRNGFPVAVSKGGKVVFIYKDHSEVIKKTSPVKTKYN